MALLTPLVLGSSPDELQAASALRAGHHLQVVAPTAQSDELEARGFSEAPHSVNSLIDLPFRPDTLSRNHRKSFARARDHWSALGLRLEVRRTGDYSLRFLLDQIYYPVFARQFYRRGIAPYDCHLERNFLALLDERAVLGVVYCDDAVVGAALMRVMDEADPGGHAGPWILGLVMALDERVSEARRAMIEQLAAHFHDEGFRAYSLGRDLPWCAPRYCNVLLDKIRICDRLVAEYRSDITHWYSWCPDKLCEGLLFFARDGCGTTHRSLGEPLASHEAIARQLNLRTIMTHTLPA